MSEIDKIFAAKGNAKLIDPQPPVSSHSSKHTKKKRKHKTNLPQADNPGADPPSNSKKRPEPETIIDTSSDIHPKRPRLDNPLKKVKSKRSTEKDDEAIFKDSRGSTTRRTTEEGWLVYKEDELRIGEDGGDTTLCPFDCDCCF